MTPEPPVTPVVPPPAVRRWHAVVATDDPGARDALLADLLADDVVFRSPAVHSPQAGRLLTTTYLRAATTVLRPTLRYERELVTGDSACLEFHADLGGTLVHGVDLLRWGPDDRLVEFTVMVRPLRGLTVLVERMQAALQDAS